MRTVSYRCQCRVALTSALLGLILAVGAALAPVAAAQVSLVARNTGPDASAYATQLDTGRPDVTLRQAGATPADAGEPNVGEAGTRTRAEHYQAIREEVLGLVDSENPRVALARFRALMKEDPVLLRNCHPFAHQIGRRAYARYGGFAEAATYRDDICNSGYLHGAIEAHFLTVRDPLDAMRTICDVYEQGRYASWQCYHGVGHGVMFFKKNDLPAAIALCTQYETAFARSSCVNGAYMENFNAEPNLHPSRFVNPADPFFPCAEQDPAFQGDCYLYVPTYYLGLHERDYGGALRLCAGAEGYARQVCTQGVGSQAIKENLDDPALVEAVCASGEPWQQRTCIDGMVGLFLNHHGAIEPGEALCPTLRPENQGICTSVVHSRRGFF
jgi:hypothetical protein